MRSAQKTLKGERLLRQQAELDNAQRRQQLENSRGIKGPLFRAVSASRDWLRPCGNQCYAGRRHCPMCQLPRNDGYTLTGFVRGVLQTSPNAVKVQALQREVLGYHVARIPFEANRRSLKP